jgi:hypothetical protein
MTRFDDSWARGLQALLDDDARYRAATELLVATIRLGSVDGGVDLLISPSGTRVTPADIGTRADFGVSGSPGAWEELFRAPRVSLAQLVRQGALRLEGDTVQAMFWWKALFLIAESGRELEAASHALR